MTTAIKLPKKKTRKRPEDLQWFAIRLHKLGAIGDDLVYLLTRDPFNGLRRELLYQTMILEFLHRYQAMRELLVEKKTDPKILHKIMLDAHEAVQKFMQE